MDDLPLEVYQLIFDYLDIGDLFELRCVSTKFKYIVSEFRARELVFLTRDELDLFKYNNYGLNTDRKFNWFYINKPVDHKHLMNGSKLFVLSHPLFNVQYLRRLKIYTFESHVHKITSTDINRLAYLEVLEINLNSIDFSNHDKVTLRLPNLSVLYLSRPPSACTVEIDTPNLKALSYSPADSIRFTHPSSIEHLRLYSYESDSIASFENLNCLELCRYNKLSEDLSTFNRNLNEIKLHFNNSSYGGRLEPVTNFVQNQDHLKLYYAGVRLLHFDEFKCFQKIYKVYRNSPSELLSLYIDNYASADCNLFWIVDVDYSLLVGRISKIEDDFFDKFNNIRTIRVTKQVSDADHLMKFISRCYNLMNLMLENASLGQHFFDELPSISSLDRLEIGGKQQVELNFEFIMKMFNLKEFRTDQQLPVRLISDLGKFRKFRRFEFKLEQNSICKSTANPTRYYFDGRITELPQDDLEFEQVAELCRSLKNIRTRSVKRIRI